MPAVYRRRRATARARRLRDAAERADLPAVAGLGQRQGVGRLLVAGVVGLDGRARRRAVDRDLLDLQLEAVGVAQRVLEAVGAGALRIGLLRDRLDLGDEVRRQQL